jgi:hypothetical protein
MTYFLCAEGRACIQTAPSELRDKPRCRSASRLALRDDHPGISRWRSLVEDHPGAGVRQHGGVETAELTPLSALIS